MSHYFLGQRNETSTVKGTGRKYTDWSKNQESQHSVLWLIEHAVTVEMLEDVLKFANYQTNAQPDTRRTWANAAEQRMFILKRRPPSYEPIAFEEFREQFNRHVATLDLPDWHIPVCGGFQELRMRELMLLPEGKIPAGTDYLAVTRDGPTSASISAETQVLIDAAEVPRFIAPELRLAREDKGRLAVYTDGKAYSATVSGTVTEMKIVSRRTKCPPFHPLNMPAQPIDPSERVYNEWDVLFYRNGDDVTKEVVTETHPDTMRQSSITSGAAVFNSEFGVAPMLWKLAIEERFGVRIEYLETILVPAKPGEKRISEITAIQKITETLKRLDEESFAPHTD